eukprot:1342623-Pyramimonas_sp.AAC.1
MRGLKRQATAHGLGFMVFEGGFMVYGGKCMVVGGKIMVFGAGFMVFGDGFTVFRRKFMVFGGGLQDNLTTLLAARACMGIGEGVAMPAMNSMLSRWVPRMERSRSLSLVYSGMYTGSIMGLAFSPHIIEWCAPSPATTPQHLTPPYAQGVLYRMYTVYVYNDA